MRFKKFLIKTVMENSPSGLFFKLTHFNFFLRREGIGYFLRDTTVHDAPGGAKKHAL